MDPQLEGYLRKIFGSLSAIEQNQEKQRQEHGDLVQQVESMKYSIASQNDRLEEMSSLTMPKSLYRPDAEGSSERADQSLAAESQEGVSLSQITTLMKDIVAEVTAQKEELKSATETLKSDILKFTEAAKKIKDYQNETEKSIRRSTDEISKMLEQQKEHTEASISGAVNDLSQQVKEEIAKCCNQFKESQEASLKSAVRTSTADIVDKCVEAVKDCHIKTKETIEKSAQELSKVLEKQTCDTGNAVTKATEKITEEISQTKHQLQQTQELKLKSAVESVGKDIVKCTKTIAESQQNYDQNIATSLKSAVRTSTADIVDKCVEAVKDCHIKTKETIEKSAQELSKVLEKQTCDTGNAITNAVTKATEKITEEISQTKHQLQQTQELKLKSAVESVGKDIVKCTKTIAESQQNYDQNIATKFEELSTKVYRSKLEVFYHVEKECQLIRDCQQLTAGVRERKKYIGYFYVENFKALIRSGEAVHSYPWRIDQFQSSVQGYVRFKTDGNLKVCLVHGRHPREVGLERRSVNLRVTAIVMDLSKTISDYRVGQVTWTFNEENMPSNRDWGRMIDSVSCQKLVALGFASKEKDYQRGAILLRYEIEVV